MRVEIARSPEEIGISPFEWERLLTESETDTVFQTRDWILAWWEVFGTGCEMLFIKAFEGEELLGFAPMMLCPDGLGGQRIRFIGDSHADYQDFVAGRRKREVVPRLLEELLQLQTPWVQIALSNVPAQSSTIELLRYTCECLDHPVLIAKHTACATRLIEGREQEARQLVGKYSLRRPLNYFRRHGTLEVRNLTEVQEARRYLAPFFEQHISRWHDTSSPSLFLNRSNQIFYDRLLQRMLPTGRLLFSVAELEGHPISFHYGFDYSGSVLWYKPSYDKGLAKRSPGLVMIKHLLDYCLEHQRTELDFTVGDEDFKYRYTNVQRENLDLRVYRLYRDYALALAYRRTRRLAKKAAHGARQIQTRLSEKP